MVVRKVSSTEGSVVMTLPCKSYGYYGHGSKQYYIVTLSDQESHSPILGETEVSPKIGKLSTSMAIPLKYTLVPKYYWGLPKYTCTPLVYLLYVSPFADLFVNPYANPYAQTYG